MEPPDTSADMSAEVTSDATEDLTPYRFEIGDAAIADLRDRLTRTRWPDQLALVRHRRWTTMERGGHFAALEVADLYAAELAAFTEQLR